MYPDSRHALVLAAEVTYDMHINSSPSAPNSLDPSENEICIAHLKQNNQMSSLTMSLLYRNDHVHKQMFFQPFIRQIIQLEFSPT